MPSKDFVSIDSHSREDVLKQSPANSIGIIVSDKFRTFVSDEIFTIVYQYFKECTRFFLTLQNM